MFTAYADNETRSIDKMPTGIEGFDRITVGGLPRNRTTLVVGGPGTGKTVFALNALVNGARMFGEPGIFVAFEENARQIITNAESFGWDIPDLTSRKLFFIDAHMSVDVVRSGGFDLQGLLAGIVAKADELSQLANGAKVRLVFDAADVLLSHLQDPYAAIREVQRIHDWLQQDGISGIITAKFRPGERNQGGLYDAIQFMADCVIELKRDVIDRISNRSLTVVKYRGSSFAENEFNMVIGPNGIEIPTFSITDLDFPASKERISTGIERLDHMLSGGYLRNTSILVTGLPGTAKSTIAGLFVEAACQRGEWALYISFDEGPNEIVRNLSSVSIDFQPYIETGQLKLHSVRADAKGAIDHLVDFKSLVTSHHPQVMVIDPLSSFLKSGNYFVATTTAQRMIYEAKASGITLLMTSLLEGPNAEIESTPLEISTVADTWIHLSYVILGGERNRALTVVKSRGTKHSNQVRELIMSSEGVTLSDVYTAGGEVLMGTLRFEKEAAELRNRLREQAEAEIRRVELENRRAESMARLESLRREIEAQDAELRRIQRENDREESHKRAAQDSVIKMRGGDKEGLEREEE